jgi:hypothetical protein
MHWKHAHGPEIYLQVPVELGDSLRMYVLRELLIGALEVGAQEAELVGL